MQARDRQVRLQDTVRSYAAAVRWGDFDTAAEFIRSRNTTPTPVDREFLKGIRVTAYDIKRGLLSADDREAVFQVTFNYYHTDSATVHTLIDRQSWWYEEEAKRWLLDGSLPDFQSHIERRPLLH